MKLVLAATHHDPEGRLAPQTRRALPALAARFSALAVVATEDTAEASLAPLHEAGASVRLVPADGLAHIGRARRAALELALETGAETLLFCDFDRALHWAEQYPAELALVAEAIPAHDLTVLGRTPRAFASHPRAQRDTEAIINTVFEQAGGLAWDVTAAARGLSHRGARDILASCPEQSVGTDVAWPLFALRGGALTLAYRETEGLEFETPDRFAEEIAAAGGLERWVAQIDADPRQWALRLEVARFEVLAAMPYTSASLGR
ncbi:MAG: hypothetical protein RLZZ387_5656 [Chloroflexota bacterium]